MASIITGIAATTELDAVNIMLASIGEAPVSSLTDAVQADIEMSVNLLGDVTREIQTLGWKFNAEFELPIPKAGTFTWNEWDSTTLSIDVFTPPQNLASWKLSERADQCALDVAVRPAKQYAGNVDVFYDRARNRDGFPAGERKALYIDAVWWLDFERMPETARRYTTIRAARMLAQKALGSQELSQFAREDETYALRLLARDQGQKDHYNLLQNVQTLAVDGFRPRIGGVVTPRRAWR